MMGSSRLFRSLRKRNPANLHEQSFLRNGALLLEKQIAFGGGNAARPIKIFTAKEIQSATSRNQIIGYQHGDPLYKGVVDEQIVVAIKKYNEIGYVSADDVLNMVVVQSQVVHRNVLKIVGCCLETPVPCVVFEFMPKDNLSNYIHGNPANRISWYKRLRLAIQIAETLCYLHTAGSRCIVHRDIQSRSILLDHHYTPKLSNFEISTSTTIGKKLEDEVVRGRSSDMDSEYALTGKVTEKIDVYSFGVVLLELLTGMTPVQIGMVLHQTSDTEADLDQPWEIDETYSSVGAYLILHVQEKRLETILDAVVLEDGGMEQLEATAKLAVRCLQIKGEGRPAMKEVAQELIKIERMTQEPSVASI